MEQLRARWIGLCDCIGVRDPANSFGELEVRYNEPHRAYHNLTHIAECLLWHDHFAADFNDAATAEFALWMHDVVYEPLSKDNEEQSAEYATAVLGQQDSRADIVRSMIHATRHLPEPLPPDESLVADIDMLILAADQSRYVEYTSQVRREYAAVNDEDFKKGRSAFLQSLLARPQIYRTANIREQFEVLARDNIKRELMLMA